MPDLLCPECSQYTIHTGSHRGGHCECGAAWLMQGGFLRVAGAPPKVIVLIKEVPVDAPTPRWLLASYYAIGVTVAALVVPALIVGLERRWSPLWAFAGTLIAPVGAAIIIYGPDAKRWLWRHGLVKAETPSR